MSRSAHDRAMRALDMLGVAMVFLFAVAVAIYGGLVL